jgi:hypothetical protein
MLLTRTRAKNKQKNYETRRELLMATKEQYYELVIKKFSDEDTLTEFLNKPDILNKWSDEDREYFIVQYLLDNGWEEVVEEQKEEKGNKKNGKLKTKVNAA